MSNIQNLIESFKGLSVEELLTIIAAATAEAKKSAKVVAKAPKEAKEKKGSMPKGMNPPQLDKPRKWVEYVLKRANEVGWPAITVKDTVALPASVERDGKHVFEATGKPLNNKQAMSLPKESSVEVAASADAESDAESESSVEVSLEVPAAPKEKKEKKAKKTEEEKEAEKVAKKEAADLKKTQEKEVKEAAKKAEKEAKKAASKEEAPKAKPVAMKLKKAAPKVEERPFDIEADTMVHEWVFQGKKVYVNSNGEMWERTDSDEAGPWMGKYDPATKVLDASASEPLYADEE